MQKTRSGRGLIWLALVALVALGVLALWLSISASKRKRSQASSPVKETPAAVEAEAPRDDQRDELPVRFLGETKPGEFPAMVRGRPLIEAVTVEPKVLCAGNPLVVTIGARDPDGQDNDVITGVGYERGAVWATTYAEPGQRQVLISAFNSRGDYEQRSLSLDVQACAQPPLVLEVTGQRIRTGTFAFVAKLPPRASGEAPTRYDWDFGDGEKATTLTPYVEHSYERRPMDRAVSAFLIRVKAARASDELAGVTSVSLTNVAYLNREVKGMIVPSVIVTAARMEGPDARIDAVMLNYETEVLAPDEVSLRVVPCTGNAAEEAPGGPSMLSTTRFAPGETPFVVKVPASSLRDGCTVALTLSGQVADGRPLYASFGARVRLPSGPAPGQRPIEAYAKEDPIAAAQLARLQAAAKALGRDLSKPGTVITNEELLRLEAQGEIPPLPPLPGPGPRRP